MGDEGWVLIFCLSPLWMPPVAIAGMCILFMIGGFTDLIDRKWKEFKSRCFFPWRCRFSGSEYFFYKHFLLRWEDGNFQLLAKKFDNTGWQHAEGTLSDLPLSLKSVSEVEAAMILYGSNDMLGLVLI